MRRHRHFHQFAGLRRALKAAQSLGYGAARARVSASLGMAMLQREGGGWSRTDLPAAHEHLSRALSLATMASNTASTPH